MAQGIGLAGGYGAGGARDALVDLIAQRMAQQEFEEKRRQAANAETLARETLGQRKTEATAEDLRAKAGLRENQRQFGETLGLNVKKLGEDTRQFDVSTGENRRQFDTGLGFKQSEAQREQGNTERGFGLKERQLTEEERANRAGEGIARGRATSGRGATKIVQGTDDQGRPASFLIDQEGNIVKSFGKPITNAERTQQIEADAAAKAVSDIETLFKDEYVGPIQGRLGKASSATGIGLTPERAEFAAAVAHMKNEIIKNITGAAVGVQEERRIMGEIPDVTDPPETFRAKLATTKRNREYLQSRVAERTGGARPTAGADPGKGQQFDFDPKTGALVPRGGR